MTPKSLRQLPVEHLKKFKTDVCGPTDRAIFAKVQKLPFQGSVESLLSEREKEIFANFPKIQNQRRAALIMLSAISMALDNTFAAEKKAISESVLSHLDLKEGIESHSC